MMHFIRSLRPLNLIIITVTQFLVYYFLGSKSFENADSVVLVWLSTLFIAAAGYLMNDYFDINRDINNGKLPKWSQVQANKVSFRICYLLFNSMALFMGFLINIKLLYLFAIIIGLLFLYNVKWKDLPLLGNVTIAFLSALSLLVVRIANHSINPQLLFIYALFAFILTWIREWIKDAQDQQGDKMDGANTMVQIFSPAQNLNLIRLLIVFAIAMLYSVWGIVGNYFRSPLKTIVLIYAVICVVLPLIVLLWKAFKSVPDYKGMSNLAKYIMITGILSMTFF